MPRVNLGLAQRFDELIVLDAFDLFSGQRDSIQVQQEGLQRDTSRLNRLYGGQPSIFGASKGGRGMLSGIPGFDMGG